MSFREGPAQVKLEKVANTSPQLVFQDEGLAVRYRKLISNMRLMCEKARNNGSNLESCRGNVQVKNGLWYYEARVERSGDVFLGWCTSKFKSEPKACDSAL